jgi:hypothetical protein
VKDYVGAASNIGQNYCKHISVPPAKQPRHIADVQTYASHRVARGVLVVLMV